MALFPKLVPSPLLFSSHLTKAEPQLTTLGSRKGQARAGRELWPLVQCKEQSQSRAWGAQKYPMRHQTQQRGAAAPAPCGSAPCAPRLGKSGRLPAAGEVAGTPPRTQITISADTFSPPPSPLAVIAVRVRGVSAQAETHPTSNRAGAEPFPAAPAQRVPLRAAPGPPRCAPKHWGQRCCFPSSGIRKPRGLWGGGEGAHTVLSMTPRAAASTPPARSHGEQAVARIQPPARSPAPVPVCWRCSRTCPVPAAAPGELPAPRLRCRKAAGCLPGVESEGLPLRFLPRRSQGSQSQRNPAPGFPWQAP